MATAIAPREEVLMHPTRLARLLLLLGLLLAGTAAPVAGARAAGAAPDEACFPQTGFCVQGRFLAYWQVQGGWRSTATR